MKMRLTRNVSYLTNWIAAFTAVIDTLLLVTKTTICLACFFLGTTVVSTIRSPSAGIKWSDSSARASPLDWGWGLGSDTDGIRALLATASNFWKPGEISWTRRTGANSRQSWKYGGQWSHFELIVFTLKQPKSHSKKIIGINANILWGCVSKKKWW